MGKEQVSYVLLVLLALLLIIIGIQGNVGTLIAILFVPSDVTVEDK